jgi:hypothetical protein
MCFNIYSETHLLLIALDVNIKNEISKVKFLSENDLKWNSIIDWSRNNLNRKNIGSKYRFKEDF